MALTFNSNNTYIKSQMYTRLLTLSAPTSLTPHFFNQISSSYELYFCLHSGTRLPIDVNGTTSNYNLVSNGWANTIITSQPTMLIYWGGYTSETYPKLTIDTGVSGFVNFNANFFNAKYAVQAGTATWFSINSVQSGKHNGVITGTVGTIGSGADLQIGNTTLDLETEYTIPEGFRLNIPQLFSL